MHHFLPLRKYEVMLFEVFTEQLCRSLAMLHDYLAIFVVLWSLIQIPPPTTLLEELEEQLCIISAPNKASIVLEKLPFEVKVYFIAFVQCVKQFGQHLLLCMADERLAPQVAVLGQRYLKLLCKTLDCSHVYVGTCVVCCRRRHLLIVSLTQKSCVK